MNTPISYSHLPIFLLFILFTSTSNGLTFSDLPVRRGPNNNNNNINSINSNMLSSLGSIASGSRQTSMLQSCAAAIGSGALDTATPFCRAWLLAMFRNRNEDVQRLMELSAPDMEPPRGIQEMKILAKAFKKLQDFDVNKLPSRPEGAYFYSPTTHTWERIRF